MKDLKQEHFQTSNLRPITSDDGTVARNILTVLQSLPDRKPEKEKPDDNGNR